MSSTPPMSNPAQLAPNNQQQNHTPEDIDNMVATYLQKKGYKATEVIFAREAKGEAIPLDALNQRGNSDEIMAELDKHSGEDPDVYDVSYKNLREWIENSLDWYKVKAPNSPKFACVY